MVYLFLPSCIMYCNFVLWKKGGVSRYSITQISVCTIFLFVYSSHSNLQRTRKAVRRLITLRLTFLRSNRQNDSTNARSLLDVINNKRISECSS